MIHLIPEPGAREYHGDHAPYIAPYAAPGHLHPRRQDLHRRPRHRHRQRQRHQRQQHHHHPHHRRPARSSDDEVGECSNRLPPIDQTEVPPGKVGEPYTVTFTVGDDTTLDWTLTSDDPPPGLGFDAATATLSGTPTLAGEYKIAIQASVSFDDSECPTHPATADYTLTIAP